MPSSPSRTRIVDIAHEAGVSTATVDRVLNRRPGVRESTIQRVLKIAGKHDYLPESRLFESLRPKPLRLTFLLPSGTNRYLRMLGDMVTSSEEHLAPFNVRCRNYFIEGFNPEVLAERLLYHGRRADGVAFMALEHPRVREAVATLADEGIPVVTLVSDLTHSRRVAYVGLDNRAAGRTAGLIVGRFLGGRGAVALIAGSRSYRGHEEREVGFLCKITPAGRKVFMLQYRTNAGERRKPALGQYGELTVEQARVMAQEWLAEVRRGGDPSAAKNAARKAPTMKEYCHTFMEDYSKQRNKPSTQRGYQGVIDRCIIPILGRMKVQDVKRPDVAALMKKLAYKPAEANRTFGVLRKMFNLAEVWGLRPDGTNPCRHVPMYPPGKETRLIVDDELVRIFRQLEKLEAEGLENYVTPLAIRLQFEFAARRSEICPLEWNWIDLEKRRVVWPDSKTGGISKPMSEEAYRLLSTAPRLEGCPYVLPSPNDPNRHLTHGEHYGGWKRVLKAAGVPHVGTHGIRHRSTTDIANSGVPTKVGMKLTGHKTVAMFMHYVHTEDKPVREAAELVASRRQTIVGARQRQPQEAVA